MVESRQSDHSRRIREEINRRSRTTNEVQTDQPGQSHAEPLRKQPFQTHDVGHGGEGSVWPKSGSRGDYHEVTVERSYRIGGRWRRQILNVPNSVLPDRIEKLQPANAEHIDQQRQAFTLAAPVVARTVRQVLTLRSPPGSASRPPPLRSAPTTQPAVTSSQVAPPYAAERLADSRCLRACLSVNRPR
jgi:hypothetical protein